MNSLYVRIVVSATVLTGRTKKRVASRVTHVVHETAASLALIWLWKRVARWVD